MSIEDNDYKGKIEMPIKSSSIETTELDMKKNGSNSSNDAYFELYYQFLKFKEKPLIRMANWVDQLIPENCSMRNFLGSVVNKISKKRNQAKRKQIQNVDIENTTKDKGLIASRNLSQEGTKVNITKLDSKNINLGWTNKPHLSPDILFFTTDKRGQKPEETQKLIENLSVLGHRTFYIQVCSDESHTLSIEEIDNNACLVNISLSTSSTNDQPVISDRSIKEIFGSLKMLKDMLGINSAVVMIDLHFWRKLAVQLRERFGWKIIVNTLWSMATVDSHGELAKRNQLLLLNQCDLVLSSNPLDPTIKSLQDRTFMVGNDGMDISGAKLLARTISQLFPKISIIIITFNSLDYTKMCLDSIEQNTDYPNYELIIVDNASIDQTADYIGEYCKSRRNIKFIRNVDNLGFATANNQGAKAATGEYLILLNNDTIVTQGWMYRLYRHLQNNPSAGMVGPVTNAIGNEAKIQVEYTELSEINTFAALRSNEFDGQIFTIRVLALYCAIISRELYINIGGLDERYRIGMFEDDDLALKIEMAGLNLLCAEDVFIHHFHGTSFKQNSDEENQRIFHENKLKFETKWGISWQIHQNRN